MITLTKIIFYNIVPTTVIKGTALDCGSVAFTMILAIASTANMYFLLVKLVS